MGVPDFHLEQDDVQVAIKGANIPVYVDDSLSSNGWRGGQWVQYSTNTVDTFKNVRGVTVSAGIYVAGFLLRGSDFHPVGSQRPGTNARDARLTEYNWSSYKPTNTRWVTMCIDGSYLFKMYERYAFPNRTSGTELVYTLSQDLYISERGLLTTYADAINAGIASPVWVAVVWMTPSADNEYRLGAERF